MAQLPPDQAAAWVAEMAGSDSQGVRGPLLEFLEYHDVPNRIQVLEDFTRRSFLSNAIHAFYILNKLNHPRPLAEIVALYNPKTGNTFARAH